MSSLKSKETKTTLTNKQRKAIIEHKEKNLQITQADLVGWVKQKTGLDIYQSTISRLLKNKETIGKNLFAKRQRTVKYPESENILIEWILQSQESIILSDKIIIEKAKNFQIKHKENASVDDAVIEAATPWLKKILKEYDLKDIYNMDEI
ncbi:9679_t:CDS:2, partial [Dentiscutata erythropus]